MTYDQAHELMHELLQHLHREKFISEHPDRLKDLTIARVVGPRATGLLSLRDELEPGRKVVHCVRWSAPLPERPAPPSGDGVEPTREVRLEPPAERALEVILAAVR